MEQVSRYSRQFSDTDAIYRELFPDDNAASNTSSAPAANTGFSRLLAAAAVGSSPSPFQERPEYLPESSGSSEQPPVNTDGDSNPQPQT